MNRHRLLTRALPLTAVALISFVIGAIAGKPGSPERDSAESFLAAWEGKEFAAMHRALNAETRQAVEPAAFADAYRAAAEVATLRSIVAAEGDEVLRGDGVTVVPIPVEAVTAAFGTVTAELRIPFADGGIAWAPHLTFPGLKPGEELQNRIALAPRAPILARDGSALAEGPADAREHPLGSAAIDVTGEIGEAPSGDLELLARRGFPPETLVGVSGLERAFNSRLAGKPGGTLLAAGEDGARILSQGEPRRGAALKTTIDPDLQVASVEALAGRAGGVAVLDARNGDVRALAGQAFSAPQPPGSTFKMVTTAAALEKGVVSLDDEFPVTEGVNAGGRFIYNANGELCGGGFREAFANSCNAVFAPLGPAVGNDALVAEAEQLGFNSPPTLYAEAIVREVEPAESTIPEQIGEDVDLAVSALGQGEVLATPLQMASVAQTIAAGGVRMPTSIVAQRKLRPQARPVRAIPRRIAKQLNELMVGVVENGTGYAAAVEGVTVAGKTGTAELGPKPGEEESDNPVQIKDAWFAAFAPARKPRLAVGVLLIEAEASGGEVAAPIAGRVLATGL